VNGTFWRAYWKLTVAMLKGVFFFVGMAAYGYLAGSFLPTKLWLTVLMMLAAVATALAFGARQMTRD
jgi:hypothetical protein